MKSLRPSTHMGTGLILLLSLICTACAGPTTPFGALTSVKPQMPGPDADARAQTAQAQEIALPAKTSEEKPVSFMKKTETFILGSGAKPKIKFTPSRQSLHGKSQFGIIIHDDKGIPHTPDVTILYNGYDLTRRFLAQARTELSADGQELRLNFPNLRLLADRDNKVEVLYRHSRHDSYVFGRFLPPSCNVFDTQPVLQTEGFRLSPQIIKSIHKISIERKINPSLTTGLIAQESGFDYKAVSWSRAIGLTQITSLAEQEVSKVYSEWPRYYEISSIPLPMLKAMIISGKINSKNEWRLDPALSIRGGVAYLALLTNYWRRPDNFAKIVAVFKDPEQGFAQVVLASYNSGFVRVGDALERTGGNWIRENELKEARKYVNRVMSYCYHFSHQGDDDADAT
jgi:hypothetical protein